MAGVNAYKDGVVARLYKGLQGLLKQHKITYVEGAGKLVATDTVEVDGQRYTGRNVILATGSYSRSLPGLEVDGKRVITSEHALDARPRARPPRSCSAAASSASSSPACGSRSAPT